MMMTIKTARPSDTLQTRSIHRNPQCVEKLRTPPSKLEAATGKLPEFRLLPRFVSGFCGAPSNRPQKRASFLFGGVGFRNPKWHAKTLAAPLSKELVHSRRKNPGVKGTSACHRTNNQTHRFCSTEASKKKASQQTKNNATHYKAVQQQNKQHKTMHLENIQTRR